MKQDKAEYIQALIDTREAEDINIFLDCMARLHQEHLRHDIALFEESVNEVDRKGGQETEKVDRKGGQKTRDNIIQLISSTPSITTSQMATALGINRSALSKHIKRMQEAGIMYLR